MSSRSDIQVVEVTTSKQRKAFVDFFYDLYRDSPYAVPYLYLAEKLTLKPGSNPAFEFCEAQCFLAYNDGKVVGRVAAIINHRANDYWKREMARFGWFDFVDDPKVSEALLLAVEKWGKGKGMTEIAGPFGFEDMDREGMLVDGFDELSSMYVNYNYPYYPKHMDRLGYRKDNDYVEYRIKVPEVTPEKFARTAKLIKTRYHLEERKFSHREMTKGGRARELFNILNITYGNLYGYSQLSTEQIDTITNNYIKLADLNLVTCVVDTEKDDKMVGFGVSFPSFSEALRHTRNGHLLPFGWWHLLKVMKWHKTPTVDLLLIGVLPEYRVKGANAIIFNDLISWYRRYGFKYAVTGPQMETNKGVLSQWQYLESEEIRRHRIYVKDIK
ncbi:MAG: N-acetyltransferase [Prevotella sp.]|uniref:N-acetyltransferase n=1 Tax=Prevotella sp. TaxID=59823 RepID=UPI002A99029D|nr:N-acetyltransferase [Prevotella sp.]MDD7188891.1 N-acetyltransferase [Prevotella sp.]MDY5314377.1 N-acetyltransferase [Prevotella sp.]